jgi:hypothetical protein
MRYGTTGSRSSAVSVDRGSESRSPCRMCGLGLPAIELLLREGLGRPPVAEQPTVLRVPDRRLKSHERHGGHEAAHGPTTRVSQTLTKKTWDDHPGRA